jgi:hypothetical protein
MDDERIARIDALLSRPDAELRTRLEPGRVGRLLAWLVTRPDDELEGLGLELTEDYRLALPRKPAARRRPPRIRQGCVCR